MPGLGLVEEDQMATSRDNRREKASDAGAALADAVAQQMPGWKLVSSSQGADPMEALGVSPEAQQGVDVATLRKKFLGDTASSSDPIRTEDVGAPSGQVEVFKV